MGTRQFLLDNKSKLLWGFIIFWIILNGLQASFIGVDEDEAYYWMYSQHLQWGYFDHPPIVALAIRMGEFFGHNSFTTRLMTILLSGATVFFAYKALPQEKENKSTFILIFASVVLFHPYGFLVTPDCFLLFFTALFFYAYRRYLNNENTGNVLFLSLGIIGLLYSKYLGVLPVLFTFLSNPRLIFKRSAWLVVILVTLCYSPHLWWQYKHDWQSLRFHFSERIASNYRISKTTNYLIAQCLVWGPFTTIPAVVRMLKLRGKELYLRSHIFCFWGILIFFLLFSFRSAIEPHWTLTAGISFLVLFHEFLSKANGKTKKIFTLLLSLNIGILFLARLSLFIPGSGIERLMKPRNMIHGKQWAEAVHHYTQGKPIVFIDSYGRPSLYNYYYPNTMVSDYNTILYRKTFFNYSGHEEKLNNQKVYLYERAQAGQRDMFFSEAIPGKLQQLDYFVAANNIKISWENRINDLTAGDTTTCMITLENIGAQKINASGLFINYTFFKTRKNFLSSPDMVNIPDEELQPGYKRTLAIKVKSPSAPGEYRLLFSIVQKPIEGTLASPYYSIRVN